MALGAVRTAGRGEPILGTTVVPAQTMLAFLRVRNPEFADAEAVVVALQVLAPRYGIRGDVALCQMLLETGNFHFTGSAVTPDQHNYGGLGVTRTGLRGERYPTVAVGVRAHLQHLHAYATPKGTPLPAGETVVDGRYGLVDRGSAPRWDDLGGGRWAADPDYATKILTIYRTMLAYAATLPGEEDGGDDMTPQDLLGTPVSSVDPTFNGWTVGHLMEWQARVALGTSRALAALGKAVAALAAGQAVAQADLDALQAALTEHDVP